MVKNNLRPFKNWIQWKDLLGIKSSEAVTATAFTKTSVYC